MRTFSIWTFCWFDRFLNILTYWTFLLSLWCFWRCFWGGAIRGRATRKNFNILSISKCHFNKYRKFFSVKYTISIPVNLLEIFIKIIWFIIISSFLWNNWKNFLNENQSFLFGQKVVFVWISFIPDLINFFLSSFNILTESTKISWQRFHFFCFIWELLIILFNFSISLNDFMFKFWLYITILRI